MNRYSYINPNPKDKKVGDCTIRAISLATNQTWEDMPTEIILIVIMMMAILEEDMAVMRENLT